MTQSSNSNSDYNSCTKSVKFLYSYNGQILPRRSDGVLRYIGGHTRVLSVERSISFAELLVKFGELTEESMNLKCKLPNEDLDVLVSVKSDEELRNMIDEYDRVSEVTHLEMKIRAVLFPVQLLKKNSPPTSPVSCIDFHSPSRLQPTRTAPASYVPSQQSSPVTQSRFQPTRMATGNHPRSLPCAAGYRCCSPPVAVGYPAGVRKDAGRGRCCPHGSLKQQNFVPCSNNFCR
ncbi:hypothetical protein ACH5RR_025466 [Cinchona calisaya]|uniref:PB1 domain-containing protein n=1 Tax=Cinchona calisaya TaxID=153742 RepID=A0ABD2Z0U5_9GENT